MGMQHPYQREQYGKTRLRENMAYSGIPGTGQSVIKHMHFFPLSLLLNTSFLTTFVLIFGLCNPSVTNPAGVAQTQVWFTHCMLGGVECPTANGGSALVRMSGSLC